jgi:oligopeptide/dipeptide ABC transporter ATP-binding protein
MESRVLLRVENLVKYFSVAHGAFARKRMSEVRAVDGISFHVYGGETFGLVGESGCGKSTTGRLIIRLEEPTSGRVRFEGQDIFGLSREALRGIRREMQIVFQDPYASLNPRMSVRDIVAEPLIVHGIGHDSERTEKVAELLEIVGLDAGHAIRYPHEFSGGQRQRIGVARALALNPRLLILDEPVSALDVSVQGQVINLLQDLQQELGLTYIFIAHDLSVVKHISDRVAVMYLGKIVELAGKEEIFAAPQHPYTEALLSSIPVPDPRAERDRILLDGDVPSPMKPPPGCRFHTRCRYSQKICMIEQPSLTDLGNGHYCACHLRTGQTS